jgi:hypothetical protein
MGRPYSRSDALRPERLLGGQYPGTPVRLLATLSTPGASSAARKTMLIGSAARPIRLQGTRRGLVIANLLARC